MKIWNTINYLIWNKSTKNRRKIGQKSSRFHPHKYKMFGKLIKFKAINFYFNFSIFVFLFFSSYRHDHFIRHNIRIVIELRFSLSKKKKMKRWWDNKVKVWKKEKKWKNKVEGQMRKKKQILYSTTLYCKICGAFSSKKEQKTHHTT